MIDPHASLQTIQVKSTPMYRDASTEQYITTLVLPVVTGKVSIILLIVANNCFNVFILKKKHVKGDTLF